MERTSHRLFGSPGKRAGWGRCGGEGMDSQLTSEVDCDGLVRPPGGGGEGEGGDVRKGGVGHSGHPPLLVFLPQATRD